MSDFIPEDLLINVLARLPAKTLIQCTSVCKSWHSLITNPNFITTHLNHITNTNKNNNLYLIHYMPDYGKEQYVLVRCQNQVFIDYTQVEFPLQSSHPHNDYIRIIGTCNGLVCLSDDLHVYDPEMIYLWNPSIRKVLQLPRMRVTLDSHGPYIHVIGFGYDSHSDDYKVVRIAYLGSFDPPGEVDVFSLRRGTWRNITNSGFSYAIDEKDPQAYLNGAAHWFAYDHRGSETVPLVVSFDMGSEVFGEIMVPAGVPREDGKGIVIVAKFRESLSLFEGMWGIYYNVWVMKEYGVSTSWTKQFNIDLSFGLFDSLAGFTREGLVLFGGHFGHLIAYDPEAKQITDDHIVGPTDNRDSFYADAYTESLVLFGENFQDRITCEEERAANKVEDQNQEAKEDGP